MMKQRFNILRIVAMAITIFGLYVLTRSWMMSLGILMLILVAEYFWVKFFSSHGKNDENDR